MSVESPYVPDALLDEEVQEALSRNDPRLIWEMTATLATMDVEDWANHREAIKSRFNGSIKMGLLDRAIKKHQKEKKKDVGVTSSVKFRGGWEVLLHANEHGDPKAVLINADIAFRHCPAWDGVLAFDEFKQKIRVVGKPPIGGAVPRDWSDTDDTNAAVWMQQQKIYVGRDVTGSAVQAVAMDNITHAVRDYLSGLTWDCTPRIDNWLSRYLGVESSVVSRMVGPRWLISAIARVMSPGCQADYMIVFEGVEGIKKSSALATLASSEWFCDHTPDLHDKDSQLQLSGSWIVEWPELENLRKSEVTAVKQFLTRRVEKYRPPYGRYTVELPRQCVFAGTTNESAWNKSDTGARRFWPVRCVSADIDAISGDRDQLWAEAFSRYTDGAIWWPETVEEHAVLAVEQDARLEADAWQDEVDKYLRPTSAGSQIDRITCQELLSKCIGIPLSEHGHAEKIRIGRVLKALGWNYSQDRIPGTKEHFSGYTR